ncbi:MAG: hypothetical protein Q9170_007035 [Blastenia crenularia]
MHDALSVGRIHNARSSLVGYLDVESEEDGERKGEEEESKGIKGKGRREVVVEKPSGQHLRTMGKVDREARLWLLPEEVMYLVERGSLDVRYRVPSPVEKEGGERGGEEGTDMQEHGAEDGNEESQSWDGVSMSLQACYAWFIGRDGLSLERYMVHAGLKRCGYIVMRAPGWYGNEGGEEERLAIVHQGPQRKKMAPSTWQWLYKSLFERKPQDPPPLGPLVGPGLYRNYSDIYRLLHLIPYHDPSQPNTTNAPLPISPSTPSASPPLRPHFHVYQPSPTFRKSAPGPPDFYITVLSAREDNFPTLSQLDDLLRSVPYAPPPEIETRSYRRLKHGYKNVVLAIIDQGVVSYLRVADAGFGLEKMYERGGGRSGQGKRGGSGGRGRGSRGRGRGRR